LDVDAVISMIGQENDLACSSSITCSKEYMMKYLIGYDGSQTAKRALEMARRYAQKFAAEIVVIASVEGEIMNREIETQKAEANLAYAVEFLKEFKILTETHLLMRGLKPGEDIVKFANENDFEAVFIGLRRRSKVDKMLFGSNAHYILMNACCPVITVK